MSKARHTYKGLLSVEEEAEKQSWSSGTIISVTVVSLLSFVVIAGVVSSSSFYQTGSSAAQSVKTAGKTTKASRPDFSKITAAKTSYSALPDTDKKTMFEDFKVAHQKKYMDTTEESRRFEYFKAFLKLVDERNAAEVTKSGKGQHGITKFADMSEGEFRTHYTNFHKSTAPKQNIIKLPRTSTETYVDWTDVYTTAVKDQGYCGSCWAFSATEQLESDSIRLGILTTSDTLSPQQIVSCDMGDFGCDGGWTEMAYQFISRSGGLVSDADYPYTSYMGVTGACKYVSDDERLATLSTYYTLADEDSMIEYVLTTGPLSVCLDASTWSSYTSGIVSNCGDDVDHCVQVVGVDTDSSYWKVRNSWGTGWGDDGFIYLSLGDNTCDITYDPTYVAAKAA